MFTTLVFCGVLVGGAGGVGGAPDAAADPAARLAARIDERIAEKWKKEGVVPAPPADDAEFLRRVWLDLVGTVPPVSAVRRFLEDPAPAAEKRRGVVDQLLASPRRKVAQAHAWRNLLLPEAATDEQARQLAGKLETWLRDQFAAQRGYDELARELLTLPLNVNQDTFRGGNSLDLSAAHAFYQVKGAKPDALAASTSRLFLGVRIECAQCHDHPFDRWTRRQFWEYAAFFAGIEPADRLAEEGATANLREVMDRRELPIPDRPGEFAQATPPTLAGMAEGAEPRAGAGAAGAGAVVAAWDGSKGPRDVLADWMTAPGNPYFARAAANRVWAQFFGVGLVDPPDDFRADNPPSHPELLDDLAEELVASDFDLELVARAIVSSQTYQLASRQTDASQQPRLFARTEARVLTARQLIASIATASGSPADLEEDPYLVDPITSELLELIGTPTEGATDHQLSMLAALALMNGRLVGDATDPERSPLLRAVHTYPGFTLANRIETLFLATTSRFPTAAETERLLAFVQKGTGNLTQNEAWAQLAEELRKDPRQRSKREAFSRMGAVIQARGSNRTENEALADILWSLLNSSEFLTRH